MMTDAERKTLFAWLHCLRVGEHDFDSEGVCRVCDASKEAPSIADLILESRGKGEPQ